MASEHTLGVTIKKGILNLGKPHFFIFVSKGKA